MANLTAQTQRYLSVSVAAGILKEINFNPVNNRMPTVLQIYNHGTTALCISDNRNVTTSANFLMQVAGGGVSVISNPKAFVNLFVISSGDCVVELNTWAADDVNVNDLYQTQATVIINSTVTSSVNIASGLPAGNNNIGNVDIASELPAGTKKIGSVDLASELPAGTKKIGGVDIIGALPAGDNDIGNVGLAHPIPAGTNNIGKVDVLSLPAIPAGANTIGKVDVLTLPNIPTAAPTLYNLALTAANTEYSQALTNVHKLAVHIRGGVVDNSFRLAFVAGKVAAPTAPYLSYTCDREFYFDNTNIANMTLYIAGSLAGMIAEIEVY